MVGLESESLSVRINPAGAELCSVKNKAGVEFIWQAKPEVWPRHAPVLFPIVGRLKDNHYIFNNKSYSLGQHGFARDMHFFIVEKSPQSCAFELCSGPETKTIYPFDFRLRINYLLEGNTLTTSYSVYNPGDSELLFSIGAHPGFSCPLVPGESFENYYLAFEKEHFDLTGLNNGLRVDAKKPMKTDSKKLFLTPTLFDNDALVFENGQISRVSLCSSLSGHKITLACEGWPYFGIWSKKGCREFVCLEPWYGIADTELSAGQLEAKEGILKLAPGLEFNCFFTLEFH